MMLRELKEKGLMGSLCFKRPTDPFCSWYDHCKANCEDVARRGYLSPANRDDCERLCGDLTASQDQHFCQFRNPKAYLDEIQYSEQACCTWAERPTAAGGAAGGAAAGAAFGAAVGAAGGAAAGAAFG